MGVRVSPEAPNFMNRMITDFETTNPCDLDAVTFNDQLQTISSYKNVKDGYPCLTLEQVRNRKEYFKRKLIGK